ncbi:MAG: DUF4271 domain-containing protein [Phycisphaerales bacterium]|nr:DUF4271 domain-containing protein [Phycisphaerales bacterium]
MSSCPITVQAHNNFVAYSYQNACPPLSHSCFVSFPSQYIHYIARINFNKKKITNTFLGSMRTADHDNAFVYLFLLLVVLALLKYSYSKYLNNLFVYFICSSYRKQQIQIQLTKHYYASLAFNLFSLSTIGLWLLFLLNRHADYQNIIFFDFFRMMGTLAIFVIAQLFVLLLIDTIPDFKKNRLSDKKSTAIIFATFSIYKVSGIILFPLLCLLFYTKNYVLVLAQTTGFVVTIFFLLFKVYTVSYIILTEIKSKRILFFIYLCIFEILPLLGYFYFLQHVFDRGIV